MRISLLLVCACLFAATVHGMMAGGGGGGQDKEAIWASQDVLDVHVDKHAKAIGKDKYVDITWKLYCSSPDGNDDAWKESYWNGHRNWVWNTQTPQGNKVCLVLDDNGKVRSSHRGHGAIHPQNGNAASEATVSAGDFKKDYKKDKSCACGAKCLESLTEKDLELLPTADEAESILQNAKRSAHGKELKSEVAASELMGDQSNYLLFGIVLSFTFATGFALGRRCDNKGADIYSLLEETQASEL